MAQLSDDCFAFDGPLLGLDAAVQLLRERLTPVVGIETVPLSEAVDRVLPADCHAVRPVPPYDNAAVDGYAVYHQDLNPDAETVLPVQGRVAAGHPLDGNAMPGKAVRIFTGAPMPPGPDTIMMQEDCELRGTDVAIRPGIKIGSNLRRAGEDVDKGDLLVPAGRVLRAADIGLLAGQGIAEIDVFKRLRVAVFSTGDEVGDPGQTIPDGTLYDSNRFMIKACLKGMGVEVTDLGIQKDDRDALQSALEGAARDHDAIITSGGMSMGEEDHMKPAIEALGSLNFWRLAIKPGRPVGLGQINQMGRSVPVVGLPGNTVAAFTTFVILGRPLLSLLSGAHFSPPAHYPARADFDYKKKKGRLEFVRVRIAGRDEQGLPVLEKFGRSGAGILSSIAGADGFAVVDEDLTGLAKGDRVSYLPFTEVME